MSLVTVGSNGRVYQRKFDHDEARARHAASETVIQLARQYGVKEVAVRRVVDARVRARMYATGSRFSMSATCVDCGRRCARYRTGEGVRQEPRCATCAARARRTSVRDADLYCSSCEKWLPDHAFPHNSHKNCRARRGRHRTCRGCLTAQRRAYRAARKVPCASCGRPRLAPNETGAERRGSKDTGLCLSCYRANMSKKRRVAA